MKKILLLLVVLLAGGGGWYFYSMQQQGEQAHFSSYLPEDTLATLGLLHLNEVADSFPGTPLARFLSKESVAGILSELQVEQRFIDEYGSTYDSIAQLMQNPAFRTVFGDDSVLAVLRPNLKALEADPAAEVQRSLVVFATTSVSGALESFAKLVMGKDVTLVQVGELEITRIQLASGDVVFGYAHSGTVLISYDSQTIADCMAVYGPETASLYQNPSFVVAGTLWQQQEVNYGEIFLNIPVVKELAQEHAEVAGYLSGIEYLSSVVYQEGPQVEMISRTGYSREKIHPAVKNLLTETSDTNHALGLLQENTLMYQWNSSFNKDVMKDFVTGSGEQKYQKFDQELQQELGLSLDELLSLIGPQYGGLVSEIVNAGFFPVPKLLLFLQVRDKAAMAAVLASVRQKISAAGAAKEESEVVAGYTIYYWSVLPGEALQPAMVLTDNMLFVANGKSTLAEMLTNQQHSSAMNPQVTAAFGDTLARQFTEANSGSFTLLPAAFARDLGPVVSWIGTLVATSSPETSVKRLSGEVLALMQSMERIVSTTSLGESQGEAKIVFIPVTKKEQ